MDPGMIATLPIWAAGLAMAGLSMLAAVAVELTARRLVPLATRERHNAVAAAIMNVVGVTYAVLLAFVAMVAWEGFNRAQSVTDTEASLVQNVYQLIDGLTGPEMPSMRNDIHAYAQTVVTQEWPMQANGKTVEDDVPALQHLTRTALRLRPDNIADGDLHTLLLQDLNQLANARRERLLAARTPIPAIVWFVLLAGGGITVAFGSFLGAPSLRMHLAMSCLLAMSGALVLLLIVALSNPFRGDFRISPEPFLRVLAQMRPG